MAGGKASPTVRRLKAPVGVQPLIGFVGWIDIGTGLAIGVAVGI
jgi:hypothetical protein